MNRKQMEICHQYGAEYAPLDWGVNVGVSANLFSGEIPVNGCRVVASETTCGWYLWAGKTFSEAADWFQPIHAHHLLQKLPEVIPYLGLPTGWRFLLAPGHEDVWYDTALLKTDTE